MSGIKPPLAAPDLWIVLDSQLANKSAVSVIEDWLRQLPFPCCKPKSGNHTPESYRDSALGRCCIAFDRVKWSYSEVVLQFYSSENVIKVKGTLRKPDKVRIWPTAHTEVLKGWQVKKNLALRQNLASRTLTDTDEELFELEARRLDELHAGSEVCFYATHFPESKKFRQCLLLTDGERNCGREEFLGRLAKREGGVGSKQTLARYLHANELYGVICVDRPGGNYLLWIPSQLTPLTGVSIPSANFHTCSL